MNGQDRSYPCPGDSPEAKYIVRHRFQFRTLLVVVYTNLSHAGVRRTALLPHKVTNVRKCDLNSRSVLQKCNLFLGLFCYFLGGGGGMFVF